MFCIVELFSNEGHSNFALKPVHLAAMGGCTEVVDMLLQACSLEDAVDQVDLNGCTPLHYAISNGTHQIFPPSLSNNSYILPSFLPGFLNIGHATCASFLLSAGASVKGVDAYNNSLLHKAIGNFDCMRILLRSESEVSHKNSLGQTPLHVACMLGDNKEQYEPGRNCLMKLIENGANLSERTSDGDTCLHIVARYGNIVYAKQLLERRLVDVNDRNLRTGETALHRIVDALQYDDNNVFEDFQELSTRYDDQMELEQLLSETSWEPYKRALPYPDAAKLKGMVRLLCQKKIDINASDYVSGETALIKALRSSDINLGNSSLMYTFIETLIECGADTNVADKKGIEAFVLRG